MDRGNVSGRVPRPDLMVVSSRRHLYDELTPESMIVCRPKGTVGSEGDSLPPATTAGHAYVYRNMPESAASGAHALHLRIRMGGQASANPCLRLTRCPNEFGCEIPVGPFALIGDDSHRRASSRHSPATAQRPY